jgi:diguanylate cyclase (GGDEF)-like protein
VDLPGAHWAPARRLRLRRWRRGLGRLLLGRGPMRGHVLQVLVCGQLYAVCSAVAVHAALLGVLPADVAALLAGGMGLSFALHYALVRSGCTARLADPVLGGPLAAVNLALCTAGYVVVGEVRGNLLILVAQTQLLAMFHLPPRRLVGLGLLACALLAAAATALSMTGQQSWFVSATHLGVALPTLMGTAWVTRWIGEIRERLHTQAAALRQALGTVQQLATHDALTGLLNRRALDERLPALARRCAAQGRPLSLALLDIDHFKQVNDQHGHAAGDAVLARLAGVLARACPRPALAARWGGEEFLVAWPGLAAPAAAEVLAWVRRQLQAGPPVDAPDAGTALPSPTVSAGLAQHRDGEPLQALIERADAALYRAKAAGRDRCIVDDGPLAQHDPMAPPGSGAGHAPSKAAPAATAEKAAPAPAPAPAHDRNASAGGLAAAASLPAAAPAPRHPAPAA